MKHAHVSRGALAVVLSAFLLLGSTIALADKLVDDTTLNDNVVQNEIDLTVIPGQAGRLAMAYNDNPYTGQLGIAYSSDYGVNWNTTQLSMPSSPLVIPPGAPPGWFPGMPMSREFDPTITADANGNLFAACIADGANNPLNNPLGGVDNGLYVFKSTTPSYGAAWGSPTTVAYDMPTTVANGVDPAYRFNDRCRIVADVYGTSTHQNNVYVTWIKDRGLQAQGISPKPLGDIYFSRTTNSGTSWSAPTTINLPANDMANIPLMDVASDGTIYLTWVDYNVWTVGTGQIYMRQSTDGGVTFTDWNSANTDHAVASINLPPKYLSKADGLQEVITKANSGAPIAVDPNNPSVLYIAYAADPGVLGDESDVFLIKSTNSGQSWGSPLRVNDDAGVTDQAFPWIDVKPDGTIDVAWYDKRNSANDDMWDVYIAKSVDSGASFSTNYRLSDVTAAAPTNMWLGEYLGLAVDSNNAYVAFTSSVSDTATGDVWFDSVANSNIPEPATLAMLALGMLAMLRQKRR